MHVARFCARGAASGPSGVLSESVRMVGDIGIG